MTQTRVADGTGQAATVTVNGTPVAAQWITGPDGEMILRMDRPEARPAAPGGLDKLLGRIAAGPAQPSPAPAEDGLVAQYDDRGRMYFERPPPALATPADPPDGGPAFPGLAGEVAAAAAELAADDQAAEAGQVLTFADPVYEPLETEYSWDGYWPRGPAGVVVVAAEHESGKGLVCANAVTAITTGSLMPGETGDPARIAAGLSPKAPADVIMICDEDDPNEDLAWRLRAAARGLDTVNRGADLSRVFNFAEMPGGAEFELGTTLKDPGNIPELLAFIRQLRRTCLAGHLGQTGDRVCQECGGPMRNPQVVIMDPLDNLVKGSIQSKQGAGRVIRRLRFVARKTGVTIVLVHHTVKSGAIGGSSKIVDIPRRVFRIEADDAMPELKIFSLAKSNGRRAGPLKYRIIVDGHDSRIEWATAEQVRREEDIWRTPADPAFALAARRAVPAAANRPPAPAPATRADVPHEAAYAIRAHGDAEPESHPLGRWPSLAAAQAACQTTARPPVALEWKPSDRQPGRLVAVTRPQGDTGPVVLYAVCPART